MSINRLGHVRKLRENGSAGSVYRHRRCSNCFPAVNEWWCECDICHVKKKTEPQQGKRKNTKKKKHVKCNDVRTYPVNKDTTGRKRKSK